MLRTDCEDSTSLSNNEPRYACKVVAVVVTRDRPVLLRACLNAVSDQQPRLDEILVVDNASGTETSAVLADFPRVRVIKLSQNNGGAAGFYAGFRAALDTKAEFIWAMDDDGRPQRANCLATLLKRAQTAPADLVGALVLDVDRPERLAFPIRLNGKTRFDAAAVLAHGPVQNFAHLFNGALLRRSLLVRIGLPDRSLFIRGDEVEFLLRARRAGASVMIETSAPFLHPGSSAEIHAIFGGLFYAVVPASPVKQFYQFRNRAHIFSTYGLWLWLVADFIRYAYFFLVTSRLDFVGWSAWLSATVAGLRHSAQSDSLQGHREAEPTAKSPSWRRERYSIEGR